MQLGVPYQRFTAFGELLLRLASRRGDLMTSGAALTLDMGGSEANVAAMLAALGHRCAMLSSLPAGFLGDAAIAALQRYSVDCSRVVREAGRMGLYWVESGASIRPSEVLYDRAGSSFALTDPAIWDWPELLDGSDRLHLSGITPALGAGSADLARRAAGAASAMGVPVSFDGNFRGQLWSARGGVDRAVLVDLAGSADVIFGNHRDIALMLEAPVDGGDQAERRRAAEAAFKAFPKLALLASTVRLTDHSDQYDLLVRVDTPDRGLETDPVRLPSVIDRIGSGDAFAAGILHGFRLGMDLERIAVNGLALGALKHTVRGDNAFITERHLARFAKREMDVQR